MWERLSLRTRLLLPLGLMFGAALVLGAVSLQIFAPTQLLEESEPAARAARAVAAALNGALQTSANPQATLDAFVQSLGTSEAIRFRRVGADIGGVIHRPRCERRWDGCPAGSSIFSAYPRSGRATP